jgi:hypothetical protein
MLDALMRYHKLTDKKTKKFGRFVLVIIVVISISLLTIQLVFGLFKGESLMIDYLKLLRLKRQELANIKEVLGHYATSPKFLDRDSEFRRNFNKLEIAEHEEEVLYTACVKALPAVSNDCTQTTPGGEIEPNKLSE